MIPDGWRQVMRWDYWQSDDIVGTIEYVGRAYQARPYRWAVFHPNGSDRCDYAVSLEDAQTIVERELGLVSAG